LTLHRLSLTISNLAHSSLCCMQFGHSTSMLRSSALSIFAVAAVHITLGALWRLRDSTKGGR
jgi:hypothetical protein